MWVLRYIAYSISMTVWSWTTSSSYQSVRNWKLSKTLNLVLQTWMAALDRFGLAIKIQLHSYQWGANWTSYFCALMLNCSRDNHNASKITFFPTSMRKANPPLLLKSSIMTISARYFLGVLLMTLWTVLISVDQPSLWKTITTLEVRSLSS